MSFIEPSFGQGGGELFSSIVMSIIVAIAFPIGATLPIISRRFPEELKGNVAAIAAGAYFATIAFSLVGEAIKEGAFGSMAIGFIIGAVIFSIAHPVVKHDLKLSHLLHPNKSKEEDEKEKEKSKKGVKKSENDNSNSNNKGKNNGKSGSPSSSSSSSSEISIVGTILDSVPENIFVGAIIALQIPGLLAAVLALFVGNLTATIDGAERMVSQGMRKSKILKKWTKFFDCSTSRSNRFVSSKTIK
jgi:zinc transporter, ZIP family